MSSTKNKHNLLIIGILLVVFGMVIYMFNSRYGDVIGIFGVIPILVSAYLYGKRGGVTVALLVGLIAVFSLALTNVIAKDQYLMLAIRSLAGIAIGYIVGLAHEESIKLKNLEAETLALKLGVERSNDVVFITNEHGEFTYINPAFTSVYGYVFEEVKNKTPRILKSGFRDEKFYRDFWKKIKSGQNTQIDMKNMTKDGRMLEIEASVNPVMTNGKIIGFLAIQRDVTDRKRIEGDLIKRTTELEKLNKIMVDREIRMAELKKQIKNI